MAARKYSVTTQQRPAGEIAEVFTTAVVAWLHLDALGIVEQVRQMFHLERKDGCCGQELFGLLFLMTMSGLNGQRALQNAATHCKQGLANVLGARSFRSQSSMSRALRSVTAQRSREFSDWLLSEALPVSEIDRDPSVCHLDTFGELWHMVDFDGRVHAIRKRALPDSQEHSEPKRRSAELARPGYSGRKRGEVQYHMMIVQDSGTSRYLGVRLGPGNGDHRADVAWAVELIAKRADALETPRKRFCARFDGKAAGAPALLDCERAGISYLTRWTEYDLLELPAVEKALEQGTWQRVRDSGSGPRREAMEFGVRRFRLRTAVCDADSEHTHIQARVVVSRYRADKEKSRGSGKQRGEFVYELYITVLDTAAWPAPELIELYYGRVVEENRFGQKDGEQGHQKVVSWHLPGQQLAVAVSLFTWNLRLTWGAELTGWKRPPPSRPQPRQSRLVEPDSPSKGAPNCETSSPTEQPKAPLDQPIVPSNSGTTLCESTSIESSTRQTPYRRYIARSVITAAFVASLQWSRLLKNRPGWRWDAEQQELCCPAGESMCWRGARREAEHSLALIFRVRHRTACQDCALRAGCTQSKAWDFRKELWVTTTVSDFSALLQQASATKPPRRQISAFKTAENSEPPGPWSARAPTLVPSVLRQQPLLALVGCRLTVRAPAPPLVTKTPMWSATTAEQRQHRRLSYRARVARCLLPDDHQLDIRFHTPRRRTAVWIKRILALPRVDRNHRRTS